ncbi:MAG: CDP-diacylglycerol--glycerol-3-phosphate 3-phosphatidyltransferase [Chloroflexi bacterium]|nr:CDP-diacylglycerol--glycerol-3-phosphate 3-phosphatidyltransferase [Chloroflexota bacterium]
MAEPTSLPDDAAGQRSADRDATGWIAGLPNLLTGFRVLVIPLVIGLLLWDGQASNQAAACLFIVAGITDVLDGLIARRYGTGSQLGIFFDLVGDKLVVTALAITMVELGWIPGWIAVGFVGREIFVMGMRAYAGAQGVTVSAGQLGKMKMMWQYIGLAALIWDRVPLTWALVMFALAMTIASGLYYLASVTRELRGRPAPDVPDPL